MTRRAYDQFCGVARALDLLGERWTLLVVRDLLPGPLRFGDLAAKQPGMSTDLLTDRLRRLEDAGLVTRTNLPRPARGTAYALTEEGEAVRPVIDALSRFGAARLADPVDAPERFDAAWGLATAAVHLGPTRPTRGGVEVTTPDFVQSLRFDEDAAAWRTRYGPDPNAEVRLAGTDHLVLGALFGHLDPSATDGLEVHGSAALEAWQRALAACLPAGLLPG